MQTSIGTDQASPKLWQTRLVSYGAVIAYMVLSMMFYKDRMLLLDGANFLVGMINNQSFYLPLGRIAAWPTQLLPVLALTSKMSFEAMIFSYSLNIALFYLAVMLILDKVYKNPKLLLSMAIFLWIFTYDSFYMPVSELAFGIAFLHLLLAHVALKDKALKRKDFILLFIYSIHIILSHPLIIFPVFFCFLYFNFASVYSLTSPVLKQVSILLAGIVILVIVKIMIVGTSELDKVGRIGNLMVNYKTLFLDQEANFYFKKYLVSTHLPGLIAYTFCSVVLIIRREYAHFILLQVCSGIFTAVYLIAHPGFNPRVFVEIYFLVVAFFLAFYLASIANASKTGYMLSIIALLISVQILRAGNYHHFFMKRTAIYNSIFEQMEQQSIQKAVIPFYSSPMQQVLYISGTGHESILRSKLIDRGNIMTFHFVLTDSIIADSVISNPTNFHNNQWDTVSLNNYNLNYLPLDTLVGYQPFNPEYNLQVD